MEQFEDSQKAEIFDKKCKIHAHMKCDLINMDGNANQHKVCHNCVQENQIPDKNIVSIAQLLNLDASSFSYFYQITKYDDFKKLLESDQVFVQILDEIDQFFAELGNQIAVAVNKKCEEERFKVIHLKQLLNRMKEYYQESPEVVEPLSPLIEKFQQIIMHQKENDEKELHSFIQSCHQIKLAQESLIQLHSDRKQISEEKVKENQTLKEEILASIEKMNLFNSSLMQDKDCSIKVMDLCVLKKFKENLEIIEDTKQKMDLTAKYPKSEWTQLEEEIDKDFFPTLEDMSEYGQFLGMKLEKDKEEFLYISFAGLIQEIPKQWKVYQNIKEEAIYYVNTITGEGSQDHPIDGIYRQEFQREKEKKNNRSLYF